MTSQAPAGVLQTRVKSLKEKNNSAIRLGHRSSPRDRTLNRMLYIHYLHWSPGGPGEGGIMGPS